jgi:hypothetical protein
MSKIEVNQISSQCGSTLTIGQSGDTVTLACGATQSGFGRTGTVDWCTTAKTAPFTGVSGKGYFVNTTCGAVTVTLPATPTAGDIISIKDYARTAGTNAINFCRNGSKMDGDCASSGISTNGDSTTLIYVDGTKGWTSILDNTTTQYGATYMTATGGTISCCGDYKIHTFTSDGCFSVTSVGNPAGSDSVDYIVVAGGGGGSYNVGGGGGAGGFRESKNPAAPWTASPLASATSLPVSETTYPITVGGGGAGGISNPSKAGSPGSNSVFSTITSTGGGASKGNSTNGDPGGSGGGASGGPTGSFTGGSGNTPPTSPPQGNPGGDWPGSPVPTTSVGAAGGGAGAAGGNSGPGVPGGTGVTTSISASPTAYAGGGGGGWGNTLEGLASPCGTGGAGGSCTASAGNGTTNRGGGGGGGAGGGPAITGSGGSGIVIIRYKFQN